MNSNLLDFKCPCCGGSIEFNSDTQNMKCPYCDSEFDVQTLKDIDKSINESMDNMNYDENFEQWNSEETSNIKLYSCDSCGGEIIADDTTSATSCPYCGSNVVMKGQFEGDLRPNGIIPFKLDKKMAKQALMNHLKGRYFLPKVFKRENHIDEIKGVYVPFWIYDCNVDADVDFIAEKIRIWSDSKYNYTETIRYLANRKGSLKFEKIPVDASTKMDDKLMESIEPYDKNSIVDFQMPYLAGYVAEKYDVDSNQTRQRVNQRIKESVNDILKKTVQGYDNVKLSSSRVSTNTSTIDYVLYPVWILHTSWKGENYIFAMNAQTGKFVGDLPLDKSAFIIWFIIFFLGFSAIISILITLLG